METKTNHQRINITLPRATVNLLEKSVEKGNRSRFLNQAIRFYFEEVGRANLRKLLKEGAIKRSKRDLEIAKEWFPLENEAWSKIDKR